MAFSYSRSGHLYLKTQSVYGTAATLAGSNACRNTSVKIVPMNPRTKRNDKTGNLSRPVGIGGLRKATVAIGMDLAGNGSAGTAPDCDPILQSLFGQAGTASGGVSYSYTLADATVPVTVGLFRTPSTVQQQLAFGVNFEEANFSFNDGVVSKWTCTGQGVYAPDSLTFSTLDTGGKGGLGSFPTEPGSPVTNGAPVSAFAGSLTLDSTAVATLKSGTLKFNRPIELEYAYGSAYSVSASPTERNIQLAFQLYDDDSALMIDLLQHGIQDAVIGATLVMGSVAGNIWTWVLKGLQLTPPSLEDGGNRWVASFDAASASASTPSALDEVALTLT